jgi:hypothetical protein
MFRAKKPPTDDRDEALMKKKRKKGERTEIDILNLFEKALDLHK